MHKVGRKRCECGNEYASKRVKLSYSFVGVCGQVDAKHLAIEVFLLAEQSLKSNTTRRHQLCYLCSGRNTSMARCLASTWAQTPKKEQENISRFYTYSHPQSH